MSEFDYGTEAEQTTKVLHPCWAAYRICDEYALLLGYKNNVQDLYNLLCFLQVEPWCNWAWWNKLIQRPYENGDQRALKLVKAILRSLMLKRTKETKDKEGRPILVLPPTDIQVIECEQSEAEHEFYDALYKKSLPGSGKKFSS
ncbi:DNA repair protein RAD5B-like [Ipomoea triloba]|uniref:DNA repair protein RAD5B-like n=1 Tax=Ipomoea triloba TaxID=35885 RepID=UPI00125CE5C0|nr:DNA repair protein RAD5B-like [Ipomoea triloba]XP_031102220.1 DNA repair protein RAD5B-like [Ipomoea triloba]XP_031102221.1 DNA repair protein RAD5B-like [Ipomoea triloba]XP_031102222.1 DNA repair protein RAD5B-like [Ipomoea triloba]XP_031102223.1 DNA repair protein RAD5B-like [Ipomoea triloba]